LPVPPALQENRDRATPKGKFERQVELYRVFLKSASWYLIAFCLSKQEFRVFKLSRISRLEILDEIFESRDCDFTALSLAGRIELKEKAANEKRQECQLPI
jgi:predicted DNA-binding transcriptional regulator YafY